MKVSREYKPTAPAQPQTGLVEMKPLSRKGVRFSKRMVALSIGVLGLGLALIMGPWQFGRISGMVCASAGLVIFFTAGCYWGCDNESCS